MKKQKSSVFKQVCPDETQCRRCARKVGVIGLVSNSILAFFKIVVGTMFFSTALLADALYSVLDIGFSILIIVGIRISDTPPDEKHNFGHGKIEFVTTMACAVFTLIGALLIFLFSLFELHEGVYGGFSEYVLLAALISILANYIFYRYTNCVSRRTFSPSIESLAKHTKADGLSSAMVAASVIFAYWGYYEVGTYVAIFETIHILVIGAEIFKTSLNGLLDASISDADLKKIKNTLSQIPEIKHVESMRSRRIGQRVWLYLSVEVPSTHTIKKFDEVKENLQSLLQRQIKNLERVMVHAIPVTEARPPVKRTSGNPAENL